MTKPVPNKDQLRALRAFADRHGRRWKAELLRLWAKDRSPSGQDALLQQVRNEFGPEYLYSVRCRRLIQGVSHELETRSSSRR